MICFQKTDEAILTALDDFPKDLPDTLKRILQKLHRSDAAHPQFCTKIFDLGNEVHSRAAWQTRCSHREGR